MSESKDDSETLNVGDKLVCISSHFSGLSMGQTVTVERLTPTGIAVLSNGERLNPAKGASYGETHWEERGGTRDAWSRDRYYRADGERAAEARRQERDRAAKYKIDAAYDDSRRAGHTAESLAVLYAAIEVRARRLAEEGRDE